MLLQRVFSQDVEATVLAETLAGALWIGAVGLQGANGKGQRH